MAAPVYVVHMYSSRELYTTVLCADLTSVNTVLIGYKLDEEIFDSSYYVNELDDSQTARVRLTSVIDSGPSFRKILTGR